MTTLLGLVLAVYFGPTQEQLDYCWTAGWSYEIEYINGKPQLTEIAKEKAKVCKVLLKEYTSNLDF